MKQIVTIKNFLDGKLISERKQTRVVYRDEVGFNHIRQYVGHGRYVKRQVVDGVCEIFQVHSQGISWGHSRFRQVLFIEELTE